MSIITRIKDLATSTLNPANDDYIVLDGETNGTRKILASNLNGGSKATNSSALVTDFGAVKGGITYNSSTKKFVGTDASQAIKDAIASGYSKIEFPKGDYLVNDIIKLSKKILIEGNESTIYVNPSDGTDHNVFLTLAGSDYSVIRNLHFISSNDYKVNLNTNVTAKSSNNCAISINNNVKNIVVDGCSAKGFKYVVACSGCENVIIDSCSGEDNYFSVYTGFNAKNTSISRCDFKEQIETDMYGHVLYLGSGTYGVTVQDCNFEALGDDSSNIIKCGSDQSDPCTGVIVRNTVMKCRSKASFLYCHAGADVIYENCHMEFSGSTSDAYARLLQFNDNSDMYFKGCVFELDSIQRFTQAYTFNGNKLIFEDCRFNVKNTVNKGLTFNLNAGSKVFKLIRCTLDYSQVDRAINILSQDLYSLDIINSTLFVPSGSMLGQYQESSVSYSQTQSPRLFISNTEIIRNYSSTDASIFINYVKGSATPIISLANVTLVNGQANSGANAGKYEISTTADQFTAYHNVVCISDNGVINIPSGDSTTDVVINDTFVNLMTLNSNNKGTVTDWTVSASASYTQTQADLGLTIPTDASVISNFTLSGSDTSGIVVTNSSTLGGNASGAEEQVAVQGTSSGGFYIAFRLSHTRLGIDDNETDESVMLTKFKQYLTGRGWVLKFKN